MSVFIRDSNHSNRESEDSSKPPSPAKEKKIKPPPKPNNNFLRRNGKLPPRIHVKLPPISSYLPNMEFTASEVGCPQRVIVRLERLMGSDKIQLTEPSFLHIYLKRLEQEEVEDWVKRKNKRKAAEDGRFRKLALEGDIEPTDEMQDVYNHPIYRVNQMLDRLSKIDTGAPLITPYDEKLPPVKPFMYEGDLRNYRVYPPKNVIRRARRDMMIKPLTDDDFDDNDTYYDDPGTDDEGSEEGELPVYGPENKKKPTILEILEENSRMNSGYGVVEVCEDEEVEDENGDIKIITKCQVVEMEKPDELIDPLPLLQKRLGIPDDVDLRKMFAKYQSENVDKIYDGELRSSLEIFEKAQQIIDAYKRQSLYGDDFIQDLNKKIY